LISDAGILEGRLGHDVNPGARVHGSRALAAGATDGAGPLGIGIEGVAAIGLDLVLHKATHGINLLVDRVLLSKHRE